MRIERRLLEDLLSKWAIGPIDTIEPTPFGQRTLFIGTASNGDFVLKETFLKNSEREYRYLLRLSNTEIPVALPVTTTSGEWFFRNDDEQVYCLYPRLPGRALTEYYASDGEKTAEAHGHAIGLLHRSFVEMDAMDDCQPMDLVGQIQKWAIPVIEEKMTIVDARAIRQIWEEARAGLLSLCKDVPLQLIHRDAHPFNMLFEAGELTGFLDFEMVTRGLRLFDVCYCGSSMLVEGFEDEEKAKKWPALFQSLAEGYLEHCSLTSMERASVYEVMVAIELLFIAFWLDHRNVDAAQQNERLLYWLHKHKHELQL